MQHGVFVYEHGDSCHRLGWQRKRLAGDGADEVLGCATARMLQSKAEAGAVVLLVRNMGTSVKYIEEHYGHMDIDVMRKELTRDRRKAYHAMQVITD